MTWVYVPEEDRPPIRTMHPKDVFKELVEDAVHNHATEIYRFGDGINYLAAKWKKSPETVYQDVRQEVKSRNPLGMPTQGSR